MRRIICALALLIWITNTAAAQYHSKKFAIVINLEVTSIHDGETTITISDKTIEIIGNTIDKGRVVLNIKERKEKNGKQVILAELNGNISYIIYVPYKTFMWNITGKKLDEEAIIYYL